MAPVYNSSVLVSCFAGKDYLSFYGSFFNGLFTMYQLEVHSAAKEV